MSINATFWPTKLDFCGWRFTLPFDVFSCHISMNVAFMAVSNKKLLLLWPRTTHINFYFLTASYFLIFTIFITLPYKMYAHCLYCVKRIEFKKKKKKRKNEFVENPGIDPGTSRMQSGRSTIWANPPATKNSVQYGLFISHVTLLIYIALP